MGMCKDCGCGLDPHEHAHPHEHPHDHGHGPHSHAPAHRTLTVLQSILEKNDRLAERNRGYFKAKKVLVVNVLSSPGSGKTELLRRTLTDLREKLPAGVIVGDLATDNDAKRLGVTGAPVIQIQTGTVCHLDAEMVGRAAEDLRLEGLKVLFIENVGNLVCPASYDLGEDQRVVLLSVTEGEDKPCKYPVIFKTAQLVLVTKTDLAAAAGFDRAAALANLHAIAPQAAVLELSAKTGDGLAGWYAYLEKLVRR
jgi:hydrogenase nickel incorporation protein HypB